MFLKHLLARPFKSNSNHDSNEVIAWFESCWKICIHTLSV